MPDPALPPPPPPPRSLFDSLREACVLVDHEFRVAYANRAAREVFSLRLREGQRTSLFDAVPGIERTAAFQALLRCLRTGREERLDQELTVDGVTRQADLRITATDEGLLVTALDVTDQRGMLATESAERERFFVTLQSIGDGVITTDARGLVTMLNPVAESLTGYTNAQAVGRPVEEVFHIVNEDTRLPVENPTTRVLREHIVVGLANHTSLLAADGSERPIADSGAPIRGLDGSIVGTVLVFRDQTEERATQEALRQSEAELRARVELQGRFNHVAQSVPGVISAFRLLPDGRPVMPMASKAALDVYGFTPEQLADDASVVTARNHPDDAEAVMAAIRRSAETMTPWHSCHRYLHPTKGLRWLEGWSVPQREGDEVVWHGFVMDVTERIVAEHRVAQLSRMYRTVVDVDEVILRCHDEQELFRSVCDVAMRLDTFRLVWIGTHDRKANTLVPRAAAGPLASFLSSLPGSLDPATQDGQSIGARAFRAGASCVSNDYLRDPSYAVWHEMASLGGIRSALALPLLRNDRMAGVMVLYAADAEFFDAQVTALLESMGNDLSFALDRIDRANTLRERDEQLRAAQKMEAVGRLAGGIAHDFNNLLCVIGSYTEFTLANARDEESAADLREVLAAARRAESLTRQLLAFSRKQILRPEVIDLNARVGDTERMLRRLIGEDVRLEFRAGRDMWPVCVDPGQLEQVLMNLVVNARDAMLDGGDLIVSTRNETLTERDGELDPGDYVVLSVSDTGTGMDEATRARIFEPFYTTKGPGKGTGLGLSTVYGIVAQSGGGIRVESAPGRGSRFDVLLPRSRRETVVPVDARRTTERPSGRETVLVVEDEEVVRALARRILVATGYTVLTASNGAEAVALVERSNEPIDLLLTDVVMPGMNGRELATRLTQLRPHLRVLFMSGYTDDVIAHHGVLDEGMHLMSKPFNAALLTQRVRTALDA